MRIAPGVQSVLALCLKRENTFPFAPIQEHSSDAKPRRHPLIDLEKSNSSPKSGDGVLSLIRTQTRVVNRPNCQRVKFATTGVGQTQVSAQGPRSGDFPDGRDLGGLDSWFVVLCLGSFTFETAIAPLAGGELPLMMR